MGLYLSIIEKAVTLLLECTTRDASKEDCFKSGHVGIYLYFFFDRFFVSCGCGLR
jgi:hypothetical protein